MPKTSCPHCPDGHGGPDRCYWGVRVGPDRDGDGQPVSLIVQPTAGAHVAQDDATWLWELIRSEYHSRRALDLAVWLVSLDDVDGLGADARRTVTLNQIINRARAVLAEES